MGKLMKSPLMVMIEGDHLEDCKYFEYSDGKLMIEFFPTDFKKANELFDGRRYLGHIDIYDEKNNQGIVFKTRGHHESQIHFIDSIIVSRLIFDVYEVTFEDYNGHRKI